MLSGRKSIFLVLLCVYLDSSNTVPTFGNEYIHIKVHVPNEISHKHIYHEVLHEPEFHPPAPKVIHHYHRRRRRPTKKDHLQQLLHNEHDALLGSLVLSEAKTPITGDHLEYLQHADDIANNLVKPIIKEAPRKKINTYRVIEETKQLPEAQSSLDPPSHNHWKNPAVETFRIVESKVPPKHVDTYRIIESKEPTPHRPTNTYTETFKVIEDTYPHKSQAEIGAYAPSTQIEYEEQTGGDYHLAHEPHTKTLKIVETKVPRRERYRGGHDHARAPHRETIEVTETKVTKPKRFFHRQPYGGSVSNTAAWPVEDSDPEFYRPPVATYLPPKHTYLPAKDTKDSYAPARHKHPLLVDSYLPSNRPANFHPFRQNSVYEDDYRPSHGVVEEVAGADGVGKEYVPASVLDDYSHDGAVETYTGFDSYAAEHVQGVGSGGYGYS